MFGAGFLRYDAVIAWFSANLYSELQLSVL